MFAARQRRVLLVAGAVAAAGLIAGAVIGRGSITHLIFAAVLPFSVLVGLTVPTSLAGVTVWWRARRRRPTRAAEWVLTTCLAMAILAAGSIASYVGGRWFGAYDVRAAMRFTEAIAERCETHRSAHGRYPDSLADVLAPGEWTPRLFETGFLRYRTSNGEANFELTSPTVLWGGVSYGSRGRTWTRCD